MSKINLISKDPHFKKTSIYESFHKRPLGFIDGGASGNIHPLVMPVASVTHCICFEPDGQMYEALCQSYDKDNPFAKINIFDVALGRGAGYRSLYVTKDEVNTSLLVPSRELLARYLMRGFKLQKKARVKTESLDAIVSRNMNKRERWGEFIKLDCQGMEYDILLGAEETLNKNCVALYLELEFFQMYKNQRTFSEIDLFLRKKGFQLYGFYPSYISAKKLNRRKYDSEERIVWADALYFKDPFSIGGVGSRFCRRDIEVLVLAAILTGYYDFALEIVERYYKNARNDAVRIKRIILSLAGMRKKTIEDDLAEFMHEIRGNHKNRYLLAKKFIDRHKSNNSIDFITI